MTPINGFEDCSRLLRLGTNLRNVKLIRPDNCLISVLPTQSHQIKRQIAINYLNIKPPKREKGGEKKERAVG